MNSRKKWIVTGTFLIIGWYIVAWLAPAIHLPSRRLSGAPVSGELMRYETHLFDGESDILVGGDVFHWDLVHYSPEKGFWGYEKHVYDSYMVSRPILGNGYVFMLDNWPSKTPRLVALDMSGERPWPIANAVALNYPVSSFLYQPRSGRLLLSSGNQIHAFHTSPKPLREAGSFSMNFPVTDLFAGPDERHVYTCDWGTIQACHVMEITDLPDPHPTRLISVRSVPVNGLGLRLAFTPDGRLAVAIAILSKVINIYRVTSTGELRPVAGSPFPALHQPAMLSLNPSGRFIYIGYEPAPPKELRRGMDMYSLDLRTGRVALNKTIDMGPQFLWFTSPTRAYGPTSETTAFEVDEKTGIPKFKQVNSIELGTLVPYSYKFAPAY